MRLFKWIKSLFKKKHKTVVNTICKNHLYYSKYEAVTRFVYCANNKSKFVCDVYIVTYCEHCNKVFNKCKIRAGLTIAQVEKEFGIKVYKTLDYGKNK